MELVPEIDLPGHCMALLAALPELGAGDPPDGGYQVSPDWGIFPYLIAPLPYPVGTVSQEPRATSSARSIASPNPSLAAMDSTASST